MMLTYRVLVIIIMYLAISQREEHRKNSCALFTILLNLFTFTQLSELVEMFDIYKLCHHTKKDGKKKCIKMIKLKLEDFL